HCASPAAMLLTWYPSLEGLSTSQAVGLDHRDSPDLPGSLPSPFGMPRLWPHLASGVPPASYERELHAVLTRLRLAANSRGPPCQGPSNPLARNAVAPRRFQCSANKWRMVPAIRPTIVDSTKRASRCRLKTLRRDCSHNSSASPN